MAATPKDASIKTINSPVRLVCDGEDMRRQYSQGLAAILGNGLCRVELRHRLIRIDGDEDVGDVGVNCISSVSSTNVVQQSSFVEISQPAVVLASRLLLRGGGRRGGGGGGKDAVVGSRDRGT